MKVAGQGVQRARGAPAGAPAALAAAVTAPLLAFDTSTEHMAVAACGPRGVVALNLPGGAAASAQLLPQIEAVLAQAGLTLPDLAAVAFGSGPGAFTGLRTSCAVAQGLGLGLARPLLPLDSLLIVAEDAWAAAWAPGTHSALPIAAGRAARIAVAMDARMDEVYGAVYEREGGEGAREGPGAAAGLVEGQCEVEAEVAAWRTVRAPALYALAAWNEVLDEEATMLRGLAGTALAAFGARLHSPAGVPVQRAEHNRAAALLRLAQQAFVAGAAVDAAAALPLYLRDKVAQTTAERAAAKAAVPQPAGRAAEPVRRGGTAGAGAA